MPPFQRSEVAPIVGRMYQTFYPNLDRCYRLARYVLQEILSDVAVWAGQDRILCALSPDQITLQAELARKFGMNEKTLNRSIEYLRKVHYVRVTESSTDMRVRALTLTRMGVSAADSIQHTYGIVGKQLCVGLSATEVAELNRLLAVAVMREGALRERGRYPALRDILDGGFY